MVNYELSGTGPLLVLIHGLGASLVIWEDLAPQLLPHYQVLRLDLRAAGATTETEEAPLSLAVWSQDVRALLGALEIERPVVVGHSLGAGIAMKYALQWPEDVEALVLMGADPRLSSLGPRFAQAADLIDKIGFERWVDEVWSSNPPLSSASLERSPDLFDRYRAMVLANDQANYVRTCRSFAELEDLTADLPHIRNPVLVVSGSDDDRTVPEAGKALASQLPRGQFVELPGVGHTMPTEAPELVGDAIVKFVDQLLASAGTDRAAQDGS